MEKNNREDFLKITILFICFFLFLSFIWWGAGFFIPKKIGFLGPTPWSNFDGVHYLSIAENGYFQFEQAFFPFFPFLIRIIANTFAVSFLSSSFLIVYISLFFCLLFFYKLVKIDLAKDVAFWSVLFFLSFPTAFFLGSVYTESLFMLLVFSSLYFARKQKFLLSCLLGGFASATRFVGIFVFFAILLELTLYLREKKINLSTIQFLKSKYFLQLLLVPLGLFSYMFYLFVKYNDWLLFVHSQAAFGAGRSSGEIILLPQVLFRYFKIFTRVSPVHFEYWIAVLEFLILLISIYAIFLSIRLGIRKSYIIFSSLALVLPTLSGTLSSFPRYGLSSFVIFLVFSKLENRIVKYIILFSSLALEAILAALFLQGYFIS